MGVGADRPEDRGQRFGPGEDQREIESAEDRPQRLLDAARVLSQAQLLALRALDAPVRGAVGEIVEHVAQAVERVALEPGGGELLERLGAQALDSRRWRSPRASGAAGR
jgi:hypothetical protein